MEKELSGLMKTFGYPKNFKTLNYKFLNKINYADLKEIYLRRTYRSSRNRVRMLSRSYRRGCKERTDRSKPVSVHWYNGILDNSRIPLAVVW